MILFICDASLLKSVYFAYHNFPVNLLKRRRKLEEHRYMGIL